MVYIPSGTELLNPFEILKNAGVQEGMIIADMGCGTQGHFVFPAAHLVGEKGVVYAVDILKSALDAIESKIKLDGVSNIKTIWSDIEIFKGTEIADNSVDMSFVINVNAKEAMIKEATRLVKTGGKLLIVDWEKVAAPFGPPTDKRPDKATVKANAEKLGLTFEKEFKAGPYHFAMTFIK